MKMAANIANVNNGKYSMKENLMAANQPIINNESNGNERKYNENNNIMRSW